jgi:hypothetical protein
MSRRPKQNRCRRRRRWRLSPSPSRPRSTACESAHFWPFQCRTSTRPWIPEDCRPYVVGSESGHGGEAVRRSLASVGARHHRPRGAVPMLGDGLLLTLPHVCGSDDPHIVGRDGGDSRRC